MRDDDGADTAAHPERTSDADPGGRQGLRRPGEGAFGLIMLVASCALLWSAYGISGFESLSAPGAVPMAATLAMAITAAMVCWRTWSRPAATEETMARDVLPRPVLAMAGLLVAYAVLLRPLGFLPTSALFLVTSIKLLSHRSWAFALGTGLASLAVIWVIFRLVFSVLIPSGIVPEAEIIQWVRNLVAGGA